MNIEAIKSHRKTIILITLLAGFFILAYLPVWKGLITMWLNSDDYSHGFFIIPISIYVVWRKREILNNVKPSLSWWGLPFVIFSILLYLFAHFTEILTLVSFSMLLLFSAMIIYFYGLRMFRELLFPLVFLLFMIPIPAQIYSQMTIPLQLLVTKISVWVTANLNIPIYREGNIIHLPDRTIQVVQACSGLRSMISILPIGAILGYFTLQSNLLKSILFLFGVPTAILVNIIRVVLLVLSFYYFKYDLTAGTIHTVFGMIIFILSLVIIFFAGGILSKWDRPLQKS